MGLCTKKCNDDRKMNDRKIKTASLSSLHISVNHFSVRFVFVMQSPAAWSLYETDHANLSLMAPIIEDVMSGSDASAHSFVMGIVDALGPVAEGAMPEVVQEVNRRLGP
jgi:hypothetical protein